MVLPVETPPPPTTPPHNNNKNLCPRGLRAFSVAWSRSWMNVLRVVRSASNCETCLVKARWLAEMLEVETLHVPACKRKAGRKGVPDDEPLNTRTGELEIV